MHPLSGALPLPYVMTRVTRGTLIVDRQSFAPPRCRTGQYRWTLPRQKIIVDSTSVVSV